MVGQLLACMLLLLLLLLSLPLLALASSRYIVSP